MNKPSLRTVFLTTLAIFVGVVSLLLGSAAQVAASAESGQADPMVFARGAKAWANNCGRCHNMRDPSELRDDQWRPSVAHMRVRAGLTGKEARDILEFLQESN